MKLDEDTLKYIFASDVRILGHVNTPSGTAPIDLDFDKFKKYLDLDSEAFAIYHFNVSLSEYRGWMKSHGTPQCGGQTKSGTRCKNPCGKSRMQIYDWLDHDGGECALHGS